MRNDTAAQVVVVIYVERKPNLFPPHDEQVFYASPRGNTQRAIIKIPPGASLDEFTSTLMSDGGYVRAGHFDLQMTYEEFDAAMSWEGFFGKFIEKQK